VLDHVSIGQPANHRTVAARWPPTGMSGVTYTRRIKVRAQLPGLHGSKAKPAFLRQRQLPADKGLRFQTLGT